MSAPIRTKDRLLTTPTATRTATKKLDPETKRELSPEGLAEARRLFKRAKLERGDDPKEEFERFCLGITTQSEILDYDLNEEKLGRAPGRAKLADKIQALAKASEKYAMLVAEVFKDCFLKESLFKEKVGGAEWLKPEERYRQMHELDVILKTAIVSAEQIAKLARPKRSQGRNRSLARKKLASGAAALLERYNIPLTHLPDMIALIKDSPNSRGEDRLAKTFRSQRKKDLETPLSLMLSKSKPSTK